MGTSILPLVLLLSAPAQAAPAQPKSTYAARVAKSPFDRTGFVVAGGVGLHGCPQDGCKQDGWSRNPVLAPGAGSYADARMRLGPSLKFEFGHRPIPYLDATFGFTAAYVPMNGRNGHDLFGIWYSWMASVYAYPLAFTRMDPYVGVGVGFWQIWTHEENGIDATVHVDRGVFRTTVGFDVYLAPHFALGPRFDYNLAFAGNGCSKVDLPGPNYEQCTAVSDLGPFRSDLPRPWEVALMFKARL